MDAALRTLRTDSSAGGDHEATLLILRDDVATAASWSIVQHVLREASKSAVLESRLLGLVLVAVDPDSSTLSPGDTPLQNTLNAHSDAWGWNSSSCGGQHHNTSAPVAAPLRHPCWDSFVSKVEQDLRQRAALTMAQFHATTGKEAQHPTLCLAIESLSTLVAYYSVGKVLTWLQRLRLQPHTGSIIALVHTGLLADHAATALTADAASVISIQPCQQTEAAEGVLITWLRRRNGCARVTTERFALLPDGIVHIYSGTRKQSRPGPQPSAGALQTAAESLPPTAPQPPVLVGMKHELNEMEREARQAVVLPYEQAQQTVGEMRGDGTAYGRVHYIRDSDSNADSDEDPDDDLDI